MKNKFFIIIFTVLAIVSVFIIFIASKQNVPIKTAEIVQNGKVIETIDLNDVDNPYDINIDDGNGGFNTVHIEKDEISISDANCPDRLCVKQGKIKNSVYPIVCLPHKLVVKIKTENDNSVIDAVTGK